MLTLTLLFAVGLLAYAYFVEPHRLVINEHELKIDDWPAEFEGFRAVLISDLHGGAHGGSVADLKRIVETANAQNADAIFLLGDFVSTYPDRRSIKMPPSEVANAIAPLRARHGVFAVLGNHDGWHGAANVASELSRVGIRVLDGEITSIESGGQSIRLLGLKDHMTVEDWATFSGDTKQLIDAAGGTGPIVALEHSPDVLPMITGDLAVSRDLKIIVAGHTHGGQVWLPLVGSPVVPSSYGQAYAAGHVRQNGVDMFVTTGTGTSILPFRFLVPPEIAVVAFKAK